MIGRTVTAVLAAAVAGLAVSACGSDDSDPALPALGPTVSPPSIPSDAPVPDAAALRADLLGVDRLPAGFAALPDPEPDESAAFGDTDPPQCAKVLAPIADQTPGAVSRAAASFGGPNFTSVDIDAAAYANNAAAQAFSDAQALLRECVRYSAADSGDADVHFRVGGLDQPAAGDASTAFRVDTTSEGLTLYSAVSVTLVGTTVVQVALSGPEEPDPRRLGELTAAQVNAIRGIAGP
ncbi:hypothetical protein [Nocardia sp. CC227C]|uniref:hypothetical protein n=1 Tax=Nocardia sp. CC227C TaxID=3044562 RepID=UPI00278BD7E0|nr:hypothetical protein [Nocardia sp. CC227C]